MAHAERLAEALKQLRFIIHDQVQCVDSKYDNALKLASEALAQWGRNVK
jgi:hypothetical protein